MRAIAIALLLALLPGTCLAEIIGDFDTAPGSPKVRLDESLPEGLKGAQIDPESISKIDWQRFNFATMCFVDPVAVVSEHKSKELDGQNCLVLSLRRSKMSNNGRQANDLQIDVCWKGQFSKRTSVVKGRLYYDWCHNPVVAILAEQDVHLKVRQILYEQMKEICKPPPSPPCPPTACYRRPGIMCQSTGKSRSWIKEEGVLRLNLCLDWLLNQPNITNNLCATGGSGYGAAASSSTSTSTSTSTSSVSGPNGTGTTSAGQSSQAYQGSGAP